MAFEGSTLDTVEVMEEGARMLAHHPDVLYRFNRFLPDGYRIEAKSPALHAYHGYYPPPALPSPSEAFALAQAFVHKFVERFESTQPERLRSICRVLAAASGLDDPGSMPDQPLKPHRGLLAVYEKLAPLFAAEPDLSREFHEFVPPSCYVSGHIHAATTYEEPSVADGELYSREGLQELI